MKEEADTNSDEVHKSRNERGLPISRYTFNLVDDLPTEPNEYYMKLKNTRISVYPKLEEEYQAVKKVLIIILLYKT